MTYPRSHLVDPAGGTYHVCSRCVRRAFLCGFDQLTGFNFDHRRDWLERRILALAEIFAVDLFGYAVMSNHYHLVLSVLPDRVMAWSDADVVDRWLRVFPGSSRDAQNREQQRAALLSDPARLVVLRDRLGSLSWFMRCLNEPLARLANREDGCKGRFWEGRFKSQRLLDDTALLACMVYVDLNPVRAGVARTLEECRNTSIRKRLNEHSEEAPIRALNAPHTPLAGSPSLRDYRTLATWAAMRERSPKPMRARIARSMAKADSPGTTFRLEGYMPTPGRWQRALGSLEALRDYAKEIGQRWIKTHSVPAQQA